MANKSVWESFGHAFEGLSHVMWTQRHVRYQLFMVGLALMLAYIIKTSPIETLFIFSAIAAVLVAELFNTAIEVVVNMITETYHPLAKIAKDVAAAGVLIASTYALIVGGIVFLNKQRLQELFAGMQPIDKLVEHQPHPVVMLTLGLLVISIIVALAKIRVGHGTIIRGGAVSGHSAVAFFMAAVITIYSQFNPIIMLMAFLLAFLVAQSRVEGKIHSLREVLWGATVAILFALLLYLARPHGNTNRPTRPITAPATTLPAPVPDGDAGE
jgi:diacylglycerol kinase (ATP)